MFREILYPYKRGDPIAAKCFFNHDWCHDCIVGNTGRGRSSRSCSSSKSSSNSSNSIDVLNRPRTQSSEAKIRSLQPTPRSSVPWVDLVNLISNSMEQTNLQERLDGLLKSWSLHDITRFETELTPRCSGLPVALMHRSWLCIKCKIFREYWYLSNNLGTFQAITEHGRCYIKTCVERLSDSGWWQVKCLLVVLRP